MTRECYLLSLQVIIPHSAEQALCEACKLLVFLFLVL